MKNCEKFWQIFVFLFALTIPVAAIVYMHVQNVSDAEYHRQNYVSSIITDYNDSSDVQSKKSETEVKWDSNPNRTLGSEIECKFHKHFITCDGKSISCKVCFTFSKINGDIIRLQDMRMVDAYLTEHIQFAFSNDCDARKNIKSHVQEIMDYLYDEKKIHLKTVVIYWS